MVALAFLASFPGSLELEFELVGAQHELMLYPIE